MTEKGCHSYTCARPTAAVHGGTISTLVGSHSGDARVEIYLLRQRCEIFVTTKMGVSLTEMMTPFPGVPRLLG